MLKLCTPLLKASLLAVLFVTQPPIKAQPAAGERHDPAPISNEVISRLPQLNTAAPPAVFSALANHLEKLKSAVERPVASSPTALRARSDEPTAPDIDTATWLTELKSLRVGVEIELRKLDEAIRTGKSAMSFEQSRSLRRQIDERFDRLQQALERVRTARTDGERRVAQVELSRVVSRLSPPQEPVSQLGPIQSYRFDTPPEGFKLPPSKQLPRYLLDDDGQRVIRVPGPRERALSGARSDAEAAAAPAAPVLRDSAQAGGTARALAASPPPPEAAFCSYDPVADLDLSADDLRGDEIPQLAASLNYSPVEIFKYVVNNIGLEPYWGSMKGARATLLSKSGGPAEQASLLIALLRASNIPARYVRGTLLLADASSKGRDARAAQWWGGYSIDSAGQAEKSATYDALFAILASGKFPNVGRLGSSGQRTGLFFAHVWVEACVPYNNYRGSGRDTTGYRWVPLDPSYKEYNYQSPLTARWTGAFDYDDFEHTRHNLLPHEKYMETVLADLRANASSDPRQVGAGLQDVGYVGTPKPWSADVLPASLPYQVWEFNAWTTGGPPDVAALPASHRYQLAVKMGSSTGGSDLLNVSSLSMPNLALKRLTLGPISPTNQAALENWRTSSTSSICGQVQVVPELRIDGAVNATGTSTRDFCTKQLYLQLELSLPELPFPTVNKVEYNSIAIANLHALQVYSHQTTELLIASRAQRLLSSVRALANGPPPTTNQALDDTEGEFLHIAGLKYMHYIARSARVIGELRGSSGQSGPHIGLTSAQSRVVYLFDVAYGIDRDGYLVDVPGGLTRSVKLADGTLDFEELKLAGYASSAYESHIWMEMSKRDAVSTVRGLQFAREKGIPILQIPGSISWAAARSKLLNDGRVGFRYTEAQVNDIESNFINNGFSVKIPQELIDYDRWKGYVYLALKTAGGFGAGFIISGDYAGGYTLTDRPPPIYNAPPPPPDTPQATLPSDTGYVGSSVSGSLFSGSLLLQPSPIQPQAPTLIFGGNIGNGASPHNTMFGRRVNMVTGNLFHSQRDFSIRGRGGLDFVFARSYNSRDPQDGPLGFGWTHTYNQYLAFRDEKLDNVADAADTNNITDSISWFDGTGAEKRVEVSGATAGGLSAGSTFTIPKGMYFQVTRNAADQVITIREKSGLTYRFQAAAGTVGQKAYLISITDRNNNALTLGYSGNLLASVTDALSKSLTFTYTGNRIEYAQDWTGRRFKYEYDANGNLQRVFNPLALAGRQNPVVYAYYTDDKRAHMLERVTMPRGNGVRYEYYATNRLFRETRFPAEETTTYTYDDFRRETVTVDPRGNTFHGFFDPYGNLVKQIDPRGAISEATFDCPNPKGTAPTDCPNPYNRLTAKNRLGHVTSFTYDGNGNVISVKAPSNASFGGTLGIASFEYFTAFNQPQKIRDARGNFTILKYDTGGNVREEIVLKSGVGAGITNPAGYTPSAAEVIAWTIHTYDANGNRRTTKRVKDFAAQSGPLWTFNYDGANLNLQNITRVGDKTGDGIDEPAETSPTLTYDDLRRMRSGIDADWHPTAIDYDELGRARQGTDKLGRYRDHFYDDNGNYVGHSLSDGLAVLDSMTYGYDLTDRKTSQSDAGGFLTTFQYDAAGNLIKTVNPDGYSASSEYDAANRLVRTQDAEGNSTRREIDRAGPRNLYSRMSGNSAF